MANEVLNELEFEQRMKSLKDRELLEFVARQSYETSMTCADFNQRIGDIETGNRKSSSISGGITGTITAVIIGIIGYFTKGN